MRRAVHLAFIPITLAALACAHAEPATRVVPYETALVTRPPELVLHAERHGDVLHLEARLARPHDVTAEAGEVHHVRVQVGDVPVVLVHVPGGDSWEATVPLMLAPGHHLLLLTAIDEESHTSQTSLALEVR